MARLCRNLNGSSSYFLLIQLYENFVIHLVPIVYKNGGRDISVGLATGYRLDGREVGVRVPVGPRFVSSGSGTYPASYTIDVGGFSPGGKATRGVS
jgi:hypothetical protein